MLSPEMILKRDLAELGISTGAWAAIYQKLSLSSISQILNGNRALSPAENAEMRQLIAECRELATSVAPVPVDFSQGRLIRQLLEKRREEKERLAWLEKNSQAAPIENARQKVLDEILKTCRYLAWARKHGVSDNTIAQVAGNLEAPMKELERL